ncbi:TRAF3-interacting JNK-activating modulator [Pelodytes ibericus]
MVTKASKSPVGYSYHNESFDEKLERRLEFHETLRSRYNVTSCRQDNSCWGHEQERLVQSPRQQEFFKRRQLYTVEMENKNGKSPPKYRKYMKYSPVKQRLDSQLNEDQQLSADNQFSWYHNHSRTPPDSKEIQLGTVGYTWQPYCSTLNKKNVSTKERGVQTIEELPRLSIKRDSSQQTDCSISVLNGELQELSDYLMEALQREQKLKKKLCILQDLLSVLIQASEKSWKVQTNEDRLKCKVSHLENQLIIYSQNIPKTNVKKLLLEMEDQRQRYEEKTKESLQKLTQDKLAAERNLQNTQMSLSVSGDECELWKEEYENMKKDWSKLTSQNYELRNELHVVQSKLQWLETQDSQIHQLQNRLQNLEMDGIELQTLNDRLQEDNDLQRQQLNSLEVRLKNAEEQKLEMEQNIHVLQMEILSMNQRSCNSITPDQRTLPLSHLLDEKPLHDQLLLVTEKLLAKEETCAKLKTEMESLAMEYKSCNDTLQLCRENLKGIPRQKHKSRTFCWVPVFVLIFAVLTMFIITRTDYFIH